MSTHYQTTIISDNEWVAASDLKLKAKHWDI